MQTRSVHVGTPSEAHSAKSYILLLPQRLDVGCRRPYGGGGRRSQSVLTSISLVDLHIGTGIQPMCRPMCRCGQCINYPCPFAMTFNSKVLLVVLTNVTARKFAAVVASACLFVVVGVHSLIFASPIHFGMVLFNRTRVLSCLGTSVSWNIHPALCDPFYEEIYNNIHFHRFRVK